MFNILTGNAANTSSTAADQLTNEGDLGLVPFFGSSVNFESSDLGIEEKSLSCNNASQTNLNSSTLNQSFSNLFGNRSSSSNTNNIASMLNGFL